MPKGKKGVLSAKNDKERLQNAIVNYYKAIGELKAICTEQGKEFENVLLITKEKLQSYETLCYYRTLEKICTKDKMAEVIRNSLFTGVSLQSILKGVGRLFI